MAAVTLHDVKMLYSQSTDSSVSGNEGHSDSLRVAAKAVARRSTSKNICL